MSGIQTRLREYDCDLGRGGCGVAAGDYCVAASGRVTTAHAARWDQYFGRKPGHAGRRHPRPDRDPPMVQAMDRLDRHLRECRAALDELAQYLKERDDTG